MTTLLDASEEVFSKFINKARKKFNGKKEEPAESAEITQAPKKAVYEFKTSNRKEKQKALEAKVKALLKQDPNTPYPIEKLIDHSEFDTLSDSSKQRYILQLSKDYNEIKSRLTK